jgi:hypothetical protein
MSFDLGSLLQKYLNVPAGQVVPDAQAHFDQVAQHASPQVMGQSIADTLRSDQTPPLGQMVSDMFAKATPQQQAGMLNQILSSVSPSVLASLGGAAGPLAAGSTQLTPQQVQEIPPSQVQDLANRAEQHSPGIFDRLGQFYAQHPQLVKTLGSAALTIALARIAERARR